MADNEDSNLEIIKMEENTSYEPSNDIKELIRKHGFKDSIEELKSSIDQGGPMNILNYQQKIRDNAVNKAMINVVNKKLVEKNVNIKNPDNNTTRFLNDCRTNLKQIYKYIKFLLIFDKQLQLYNKLLSAPIPTYAGDKEEKKKYFKTFEKRKKEARDGQKKMNGLIQNQKEKIEPLWLLLENPMMSYRDVVKRNDALKLKIEELKKKREEADKIEKELREKNERTSKKIKKYSDDDKK